VAVNGLIRCIGFDALVGRAVLAPAKLLSEAVKRMNSLP
jgi:hypothetical protein